TVKGGLVWVWDASAVISFFARSSYTTVVWSGTWSPDGNRLASAGYNGKILIWNTGTGELLSTYSDGDRANIDGVAWSPDGNRLASARTTGTVQVWDTRTGKLIQLYRDP